MDKGDSRKVLLIGWDAADWKVINPLLDAGKMPNLERMLGRGVMGNIATLQPCLSPMLWTSIATGKRPYKHGIHGFSEPDPVTGGIRPVTNLSRKTKAIWNILNQEGKHTITIGWWPSNPAEPLSQGVMVSNDYQMAHGNSASPEDLAQWPMKPGTVHPPRLEQRLKELRFHPAELTQEDLLPFLPGLVGMSREELDKAQEDPRMQGLMKIIADCTSIHSAATALMQNEPWDLMCVYYDAIDHFGHAFMKYHPPQRPNVDDWSYRLFNACVEGGYRYHDMMLGTLLDLAGEDTTVVLLSDHGFHPDDFRLTQIPREPAGPAAEHRQFGIFAAMGPDIKEDERIYGASLLDITPTLLHLFGLPIGEDMDGRVLLDIYKDTDAKVESIESWDSIEGDHGMHPPDKQISATDSKAALEQLVALGYIDEPDADRSKAMEQTVRELDYNLAQAYIDGGIYTEAITLLERLYDKWPMEHRFGFKLASCYQNLGRPQALRELVAVIKQRRLQEAEEAAQEIKELRLDDEEVRQEEQVRMEQMSDAEKKKFVRERNDLFAKTRPNLFSLNYLEACADVAEGKHEEALEKLQSLDSAYGARRNALCLKGDVLQKLRRWDEARASYEEALTTDQETPAPWNGLARVALSEKRYRDTVRYARTSLGLLFFQPRLHYILGLAHFRLGEYDAAEKALYNSVRQAPLLAAAYRLLAQIARFHHRDYTAADFFKNQVRLARQKAAELRHIKPKKAAEVAEKNRAAASDDMRAMPELIARPESLEGVKESDMITIVSGLPRSGTSLLMQLLEAAGIPAFTDGNREADDSNQRGYYEHDAVSALLKPGDKSWIAEAQGKALKVVAPLLTCLPPKKYHYRVLFMERDMEEVLRSQTKMLQRLGKEVPGGDVSIAYQQQVRAAKTWLNAHGISAMSVNFSKLVHEPEEEIPALMRFLGIDEPDMAALRAVIDPQMHRERNQSPTV